MMSRDSFNTATNFSPDYSCIICGYTTAKPKPTELGMVRGNTDRFKETLFHLWKCPQCNSIHSIDPVDYDYIYHDYPLNRRRLDVYARGTLSNLLKRLIKAGINNNDNILDYGCGNNIFVSFMKERGFRNTTGYDPYVADYATLPTETENYDCIVANDVVEHVPNPRETIKHCLTLLKPGGLLYLGTADSEGVSMENLESHVMSLHQPFHRVIINQQTLLRLGRDAGLDVVSVYTRSYMDTLRPFANYRFLDEFSKAVDHNLDRALDPASGSIVIKKPMLLFYAFFGYFFPSAYEPAVIFRKP